jgi:hypothetical protein
LVSNIKILLGFLYYFILINRMVNSNNSKSKTDTNQNQQETIRVRDKIPEDFMPLWKKEEDCFKVAIITDVETKKKTGDTFPRTTPPNQRAYENWLEKVVNVSTGE